MNISLEQDALLVVGQWVERGSSGRELLLQRTSGTLQAAVDGRERGIEQFCRVTCGPAKHVAEQQDGALLRRKMLNCRNKGEPHRLMHLISCFGTRRRVRDALNRGVRVGFKPRDLGRRPALPRLIRQRCKRLGHYPTGTGTARESIKANVGGNPVKPAAKGASAFEPVKAAPSTQERFLYQVFGVLN